jgi:hypothetical protein
MLLAATTSAFLPVKTGSTTKQSKNPNKAPTYPRLLKRKKRTRPNRIDQRICHDPHEHLSYGDTSVYKWTLNWLRVFFQNAYGLTYSTGGEDYKYYMKCLKDINVNNVAGIYETNRAWQHPHLHAQFNQAAKREHDCMAKRHLDIQRMKSIQFHPTRTPVQAAVSHQCSVNGSPMATT